MLSIEEHSIFLGKLVGNYQSLEFALRASLQTLPNARPIGMPYGVDIYSFPVGSEVPENEMTSYDSLPQLIDKYNTKIRARGGTEIDDTLPEIRDAIAHGRKSSNSQSDTLRLLKFSAPKNGKVKVVFNEEMSEAWFKKEIKRVHDAILLVFKNYSDLESLD